MIEHLNSSQIPRMRILTNLAAVDTLLSMITAMPTVVWERLVKVVVQIEVVVPRLHMMAHVIPIPMI